MNNLSCSSWLWNLGTADLVVVTQNFDKHFLTWLIEAGLHKRGAQAPTIFRPVLCIKYVWISVQNIFDVIDVCFMNGLKQRLNGTQLLLVICHFPSWTCDLLLADQTKLPDCEAYQGRHPQRGGGLYMWLTAKIPTILILQYQLFATTCFQKTSLFMQSFHNHDKLRDCSEFFMGGVGYFSRRRAVTSF